MFGSEWTCLLVRHKIMHAVRYGVSGASTGSFLDPFFFFLFFPFFFLGWGGEKEEGSDWNFGVVLLCSTILYCTVHNLQRI